MDNKQQIEAKIRAYYKKHKTYGNDEKLESLLYERKRILDAHYEVTPERLEQLYKMNAKLHESTNQVFDKLLRVNSRLRLIFHKDGFTEDYELVGKVAVNVDQFAESEPIDILEIIDSVHSETNLIDCLLHCRGSNPNGYCELIDDYNKENICGDELTLIIGADRVDFNCSWAMHRLIGHSPFALEDIVRISENDDYTWNEVVLQYQNFGTYIETEEKYCDVGTSK